jgi:hypothetical protein
VTDGLTKGARWKRKLADWIACPSCARQWQRTNSQRQDGTRLCSRICVGHAAAVSRMLNATRADAAKYAHLVRTRLAISGDQARDVEILDVVRLMLEARKDGLRLGRQRGIDQRGRFAARKAAAA